MVEDILQYEEYNPPFAKVNLPTRGFELQLGTEAADVKVLNNKNKNVITEVKEQGMKQAMEMKLDSELQPIMPQIDANLIGKKIQVNLKWM